MQTQKHRTVRISRRSALWSSRHQRLPRQRWAWWCQGREGRTRYSLGCSFSEALYLSKETAWIGRRPMYSCRLYYSQLHIIIWNRDTALTLASQTLTQELLTRSGPAGSRSWPSRQTIPWGHGRLLFYGLYKQQLRKVSPSSVSPFPWEGIGHHVFWRNRGRTQILSHVSFFVQQVKDSEACRALLERWGLKEHQGSLGYQDQ